MAVQRTLLLILALSCLVSTDGLAKGKPKTAATAAPSCERAAYPGDPVCDVGGDSGSLPVPSLRNTQSSTAPGYRVNDNVSVRGRSDFNSDRNGPIQLNNPNPHPGRQDVNGGGAVNYKF